LNFQTTWGLFSPRGIDEGTRLLLNYLEVGESDTILDIGCGYGPLGLAMGRVAHKGEVHMVDKDYLAVEYANRNAIANGLPHCKAYLSNGLSKVPQDYL
jgi:16S rRNA G1207 methylase RsmC